MKQLWITLFSLLLLLVAGCLPQAKEQSCSTGSVFNPTSRNCVPITSSGTTSGITIATRSPVTNVIPVGVTETNQYNFAVTVNNPLNEGYAITWKFYPPSGVAFGGNPLAVNSPTYSLTPSSVPGFAPGTWTLAAEVYNSNGSLLLQSAQWSIVVSGNIQPNLVIATATSDWDTNVINRVTTDHSVMNLAVQINNPGGSTATILRWYYDGALQGAPVYNAGPVASVSRSFFGGVLDTPAGNHSVRAELRDITDTTILSTLEWTIFVVAPNLPQLPTGMPPSPSITTTIAAINNVALNAGGFKSGSDDLFVAPDKGFCVAVTNHLGTRNAVGGVTVQFLRNGSAVGMPAKQDFTASNAYTCLDNLFPTFYVTLTNPTVGEFQTISAVIVDEGLSVGQSTTIATVNWNVSVRVQNTAPFASIIAPSATSPMQQGGNPAAVDFVMHIDDVDSNPADMSVYFFFDGVAMNGVNKFPGTNIQTPNCTRPVGSGASTQPARYTCPVILPAFGINGRTTPPAAYTITGYVTDSAVYGGAPQTSNVVTWTVNPFQGQTPPLIAIEGTLTNTPTNCDITNPATCTLASASGNSYFAYLNSPTTPILNGTLVPEGSNVVFNILVKDTERDHFNLSLALCTDSTCNNTSPIATDIYTTRTSDALGRRATYSYKLPEDLIIGASDGVRFFLVSVQDKLPDGTVSPTPPVTQILNLDIQNSNPFPIWAGSGAVNPGLSDVLNVVSGMPLTVDPGSITDTSTSDGNIIEYQWQISLNSGTSWLNIIGATTRILKWTPSPDIDGTNVRLRLCLGDNGTDNALTLCTTVASPTAPALPATTRFAGPWTGAVARSNKMPKNIATPTLNGEGATWLDTQGRASYSAYIHNNGSTSTITVEKNTIASNGIITYAGSITFPTEESGTAYDASRLSIKEQSLTIGSRQYKGLYLSYVTQDLNNNVSPRLRVRHIDITDGEFQFNYHGVTESNETTNNITTTRSGAGAITITVSNSIFDASESIFINGIKLTPVTAAPSTCQFLSYIVDSAPNRTLVMSNIVTAYSACVTSTSDARVIAGALPAATAASWIFSTFPQDWVDIPSSIYLGKAGDLILENGSLLVPYLNNLNAGKLAVAIFNTTGSGYPAGSLASSAASYYINPTIVNVNTTAPGQDIAVAHNGTANFDVAMTSNVSGLNVYRLTFTAPTTIAVTSSVLNLFGDTLFVQRPRIASGSPITNNNVFVLVEDLTDPLRELFYARIDASTYQLATASPVIPLDSVHEQSNTLTEYRVRALATNKAMAMAVMSESGKIMVSVIKPELPSLDFPMIFPRDTASVADGVGFTYPPVATITIPISIPMLAMSSVVTFTVGDSGATPGENAKEGFLVYHPGTVASGFSLSFINITPETISATAANFSVNGYQPPFIR